MLGILAICRPRLLENLLHIFDHEVRLVLKDLHVGTGLTFLDYVDVVRFLSLLGDLYAFLVDLELELFEEGFAVTETNWFESLDVPQILDHLLILAFLSLLLKVQVIFGIQVEDMRILCGPNRGETVTLAHLLQHLPAIFRNKM